MSRMMMLIWNSSREMETRKMRMYYSDRTVETRRDIMMIEIRRRRFCQNRIKKRRKGEREKVEGERWD
jgi:hypothetical protein